MHCAERTGYLECFTLSWEREIRTALKMRKEKKKKHHPSLCKVHVSGEKSCRGFFLQGEEAKMMGGGEGGWS